MVYRLNETTWLQDVGGGAEIFYFLNWAMLTIGNTPRKSKKPSKGQQVKLEELDDDIQLDEDEDAFVSGLVR